MKFFIILSVFLISGNIIQAESLNDTVDDTTQNRKESLLLFVCGSVLMVIIVKLGPYLFQASTLTINPSVPVAVAVGSGQDVLPTIAPAVEVASQVIAPATEIIISNVPMGQIFLFVKDLLKEGHTLLEIQTLAANEGLGFIGSDVIERISNIYKLPIMPAVDPLIV